MAPWLRWRPVDITFQPCADGIIRLNAKFAKINLNFIFQRREIFDPVSVYLPFNNSHCTGSVI